VIESLKAIVKTRTTKQYLHEVYKQESNTGDHIMIRKQQLYNRIQKQANAFFFNLFPIAHCWDERKSIAYKSMDLLTLEIGYLGITCII
jgi:hypothetical protein